MSAYKFMFLLPHQVKSQWYNTHLQMRCIVERELNLDSKDPSSGPILSSASDLTLGKSLKLSEAEFSFSFVNKIYVFCNVEGTDT